MVQTRAGASAAVAAASPGATAGAGEAPVPHQGPYQVGAVLTGRWVVEYTSKCTVTQVRAPPPGKDWDPGRDVLVEPEPVTLDGGRKQQPLSAAVVEGIAAGDVDVQLPLALAPAEAAREKNIARNQRYLDSLDCNAELEALRRARQGTVRVRNAGDGGEGHGRGGRKRPAAARSDGKSAARKQRHRMAAASGHDALWPAVGHPSLRLSLVFREHQRGAGGVPGREDNATPVRLLPPAKVGKLDTLFALPGVWYAQQGVLAPNARALRDGTSKDAKPRGVHTVPVPEGILRGANSKHALGVLRAVDAASCALLGDGNTAVAYDLWLHSGQRSNRLLDAAFVSLGLYLPVMVTPTLFPFFPFTRSHFPLRTCVAGVGPRPACRDVYDIAFSCCTPSCDGHRQRQVGHLAAGVFGGLPRRGHRAHPGQNCKLLPTAATADTGPHQYPAVQLIGHLTGARTINRPSYGCAYN